jgi:hypothetical protein
MKLRIIQKGGFRLGVLDFEEGTDTEISVIKHQP